MDTKAKNKAVFIDRDGTIAIDVPYCSRPEDFVLFPMAARAVKLLNQHGFKAIVVTNQSGISRGYFDETTLETIHQKMRDELAEEGASVDAIYYCPHQLAEDCDCRKPKPGNIIRASEGLEYNPNDTFIIGDSRRDILAGKAVGLKTIFVASGNTKLEDLDVKPDYIAKNLQDAVEKVVLKQ